MEEKLDRYVETLLREAGFTNPAECWCMNVYKAFNRSIEPVAKDMTFADRAFLVSQFIFNLTQTHGKSIPENC